MHFHVGSFGCGVALSLILLYIGSVHRIEVVRSNVLKVESSLKDDLKSGHSESLANETSVANKTSIVNETSVVSLEQGYSIRDHVENSTFGV